MNPILIAGPAVEPVTLGEMKAHLRIDEDDDGQDTLIEGLVKAGRLMVEATSRRVLVAQSWRVMLDRWPQGKRVVLPLQPLISVDAIRVFDAGSATADVPAADIEADIHGDPPQIIVPAAPEPGRSRHGIAIDVQVGYGPSPEDVPAPLRLAIKLLVAHWFENRGDVAGEQILPPDALALVAPFQRARL